MEPLVREALEIAGQDDQLPWDAVEVVGGWWNRQFNPEVHLIGADRAPVARRIGFAGSVKWLAGRFDAHDLSDLISGSRLVPGFEFGVSGLAVTSLSGIDARADLAPVDLVWGSEELLRAWDRK